MHPVEVGGRDQPGGLNGSVLVVYEHEQHVQIISGLKGLRANERRAGEDTNRVRQWYGRSGRYRRWLVRVGQAVAEEAPWSPLPSIAGGPERLAEMGPASDYGVLMAQQRGRVYKVRLVPPDAPSFFSTRGDHSAFPSSGEYIAEALSAGRSIERYGREWIVGRTRQEEDVLTGRIGFRGAEGMAEVWDEEAKDFREVAVPAGLTAPFAVNLRTLRMALQPRGSAIKLNGLIGAFRALLAQGGDVWRILAPTKEMTFAEWRSSVDRVTSVRFRLRKPNPRWQDAPDLEAVMEQAEAEVAILELDGDDGIDSEAEFVKQSQAHVERGYGEARYVGIRGVGTSEARETVYNSSIGSEEESVDVAVGEDGEVAQADMAETLAETGPEALAETGRERDTGEHGQAERGSEA